MSEPTRTCGVCRKPRAHGSSNATDELFVCEDCERMADHLFEIQDRIYPSAAINDESGL